MSGNFANLGSDVKDMKAVGADVIHVDVMDGVFVPNLTFGFKMISDLRPLSDLPFDVHLMITNPVRYVERFVKSGADFVSFHVEAENEIEKALAIIKNSGCKCGLAVNPDTPISSIERYAALLDLIVVMSVFPGFGGQKFIDGITLSNAADAAKAGADILVAGNAVFGAADRAEAVRHLHGKPQ